MGTPRAVSQGTTVLWRWEGDAFGDTIANDDADGNSLPLTFPLRFPGQYHDAETGLHYNYFRDYDPATGRYVQSDPIGLRGGINTFAYGLNNPLLEIDPLGLWSFSLEGYLGAGGGINISYKDGTLEVTGRIGVGVGGGLTFDPYGEPSKHAEKCGDGYIGRTSLNAQAGVGIGAASIGGSLSAASGNAFKDKEGGGYYSTSPTSFGLDRSSEFGPRIGISYGAEIGSYSNWR